MTFQTYNTDIPDAPNNPSQDQPKMKANTNAINALINQDHYSFNNNLGGTHKQVTLTNESAPGIPAGTNAALHSNLDLGLSWPFWQNTAGDFQIMGGNNPSATGYAFLPGGLYLQWGIFTSVGTAFPNATVPFVPNFSAPAFSVNCTILVTTFNRFFVEVFDISASQFRASVKDSSGASVNGIQFCWMAIGKK